MSVTRLRRATLSLAGVFKSCARKAPDW